MGFQEYGCVVRDKIWAFVTDLAVEWALAVWSLTDRGGVQSIVDVSFGICRDRMFELSCFSFYDTMLMIFAECWLVLLLIGISLISTSEFTNTFVNFLSLLFS